MLFFGVDASHHAAARALMHSLTHHGLSYTITQDRHCYYFAVNTPPRVDGVNNVGIALGLNDSYFDPIEGGQLLLSAYPLVANLTADVYHPASSSDGIAGRNTAVAVLDILLEAILRDLRWPVLATTAVGELLLAYRPTKGEHRFAAGAVNAESSYDVWSLWVEPLPWPTVDDDE